MQSKRESLLEAVVNIFIGFVISWMAYSYIAVPIVGVKATVGDGFWLTVILTVTSFLRQYVLRRLFNRGIVRTLLNRQRG